MSLGRRTRLKRGKPLARGDKQLQRTELKRGDSQLSRSTPLAPESAKRKAERPARAAVRAETLDRAEHRCELVDLVPEVKCWGPLDVDERAARGVAPGSHLDATITQVACRGHHDWRHANPAEARERGIRITGAEYESLIRDRELNRTTEFVYFDNPAPVKRRSPIDDMLAAQDAAAARFEEQTGRKSTDPGPIGRANVVMVNGRMVSITHGYDQPHDPDNVDHFARHGMGRVHINTDGTVVRGEELLPSEVRVSLQQGDRHSVAQITAALLQGMFGTPERMETELTGMQADRELRARSIEAEVVDES